MKHQLPDFRIARSFRERLIGLMGERDQKRLQLVIPSCTSIHTWFMRHPIDVAFVSRDQHILAVHEAVGPWRFLFGPRGSHTVIEMPAGYTRTRSMNVGDEVTCQ